MSRVWRAAWLSLVVGVCFGSAVAGQAADKDANDWPQWRGPERNGHSADTGLLESWPEQGPPLEFLAGDLGGGYSSVAVAGDRIFTLGKKGQRIMMLALDRASGRILWETAIAEGEQPPNCTPTVDGDSVYGVTFDGNLVCCQASDGKIVWRLNYGRDFGGQMMSGWGYSESPLIDGDRLICTPGAQNAMLAALDKRTGKTMWTTQMPQNTGNKGGDGAAYSSIVISNGGGVKQYVQLVGRGVIGVDAASGKLLWGYNKIANGTANCPTPVVAGDFVFASTGYGDGGSALLELRGDGRGGVNAREVYHFSARDVQNHHGGMILVGEHLFMGHGHNNGMPLCLKLESGRDAWRPGRGPGSGSAAVAYADGHLYFRYENGVMALIEATPDAYRLKGSFKLDSVKGKSWPHPVIAGGKMYLRDQDVLMCYDIQAR